LEIKSLDITFFDERLGLIKKTFSRLSFEQMRLLSKIKFNKICEITFSQETFLEQKFGKMIFDQKVISPKRKSWCGEF
jgi:hypothetical protein